MNHFGAYSSTRTSGCSATAISSPLADSSSTSSIEPSASERWPRVPSQMSQASQHMSSVNARNNSAAGVVTLRRTALPQCLEESLLVLADVLPRSIVVIVNGEALPDDSR